MHPVLFDLHFAKVYSWGFMMALAVILSIFVSGKMFKSEGYKSDHSFNIVLCLIISGIIGSRLGYMIVYAPDEFFSNPLSIFKMNSSGGFSGMMWYGGFILSAVTFFTYLRIYHLPTWKFADMMGPVFIMGYAIVRIGCFLAGCCYGKITTSAIGVVFPVVDNALRYPTQLISSGINFIFFILLLILFKYRRFDGQVFFTSIIGYTVYRFFIEFLRDSDVYYGIFSPGQVISIPLFAIAIFFYFYLSFKKQNSNKEVNQ